MCLNTHNHINTCKCLVSIYVQYISTFSTAPSHHLLTYIYSLYVICVHVQMFNSMHPSKHATCRRATPQSKPTKQSVLDLLLLLLFSLEGTVVPFPTQSYNILSHIIPPCTQDSTLDHAFDSLHLHSWQRVSWKCAWQQHSFWKESQVTIWKAYKMLINVA